MARKDVDPREIAQVLESNRQRIEQLEVANRGLTVENGELRTRAKRLELVEGELSRLRDAHDRAGERAERAEVARRRTEAELAGVRAKLAKAEAVAAAVEEREQAAGRVAEMVGGGR